jgi:hypothetical protein
MRWPVFFNQQLEDILSPFSVEGRITWSANHVGLCRWNMQLELNVACRSAQDVQSRPICGKLLTHPAILLVYENGRFDFANFGHRSTGTAAQAPITPSGSEDDLRGRDGGSSSHAADGAAPRRAGTLDLDL